MQTADSRSLATLLLLRQQVKNVQVCSRSLPCVPYVPCWIAWITIESYAMTSRSSRSSHAHVNSASCKLWLRCQQSKPNSGFGSTTRSPVEEHSVSESIRKAD